MRLSGTVAKRDNKPVPRALILQVVTSVMIQMIFGLVLVAGALVIWMFWHIALAPGGWQDRQGRAPNSSSSSKISRTTPLVRKALEVGPD